MSALLNVRTALAVIALAAVTGAAEAQSRRSSNQPALTPAEAELALRYAMERQLQRRVSVPDTATLQRLISLSLRYRDSTRVLMERERIVRSELNREGFPEPRRAINETRLNCLLGELSGIERRRFDLGMAERTEIATFLSPLSRLQYLGTQENIHDIIDDRRQSMEQRQARLARSGVLPPLPESVTAGSQTRAQIAASICPVRG
jgi:hypothetical protein